MAPVRRAVERVQRAGYTLTVARHGDLGVEELTHLEGIADQWRAEGDERGFSMALSRLGDPADPRCVAVLARDANGELTGLLSFVPWGRRGLSLDLMRREPGRRERGHRVHGRRAGRRLPRSRDRANLAELRDVPRDLQCRRAGRRGTGDAADRRGADRCFEVLAAGEPVPVEREVPAAVGSAIHVPQPVDERHPSRHRGRHRRGLPAREGSVDSRGPDDTVTFQGHSGVPFAEAVAAQADELLRPVRPVQRLDRAGAGAAPQDRDAGGSRACRPTRWGSTRSTSLDAVCAEHPSLPPDTYTGERVSVAGRVRAVRDFGGLIFAELQDGDSRLQVMLTDARTGGDAVALWQRTRRPRRLHQRHRRSSDQPYRGTVDRGGHLDDGRQVPAARAR